MRLRLTGIRAADYGAVEVKYVAIIDGKETLGLKVEVDKRGRAHCRDCRPWDEIDDMAWAEEAIPLAEDLAVDEAVRFLSTIEAMREASSVGGRAA